MMIETEGFGLDYERYSLAKCHAKLVDKLHIKDCLELPASGCKALPGIYSFGFAQTGANVTLVNAPETNRLNWEEAGLADKLTETNFDNIYQTDLEDNVYDLVWNFAFFPTENHPEQLLNEMIRLSKRYVAVFLVNGRNLGSYWHLFLHKALKLEWTHGDKQYLYPKHMIKMMHDHGLKNIRLGLTNAPFWPDTIGFRDVRLHRKGITGNEATTVWKARTIEWLKINKYPSWIKAVWAFESIPMPVMVKMLYAHIYYVVGEKA